jgi:nucleoside-triphosphatase
MYAAKKNILLTGVPGIGKTTLTIKIIEELHLFNPVGFYTKEIREKGIRQGFTLLSLTGKSEILSHVNIKSPYHVGKYGVDVKRFEVFLDSIFFLDPEKNLIVIDEIGKMECFSNKFRALIKTLLDSSKLLIGTIPIKGSGFIEELKNRDDISFLEIKKENRDLLLHSLTNNIRDSINIHRSI